MSERADNQAAGQKRGARRGLRSIGTAALLLIAGAVVSVLVAWGCVIWMQPTYPWGTPAATLQQLPAPDPLVELPGWQIWMVREPEGPWHGLSQTDVMMMWWEAGLDHQLDHEWRVARLWRAGWPYPALACAHFNDNEVVGGWAVDWRRVTDAAWLKYPPRPLPYTPRWPGFALNTALYTAVLSLGFVGVRWSWRRLRHRPGTCRTCRYDLSGITSGVCPECGAKA